jgi:peptide/nickel transport system substrate-binding protein
VAAGAGGGIVCALNLLAFDVQSSSLMCLRSCALLLCGMALASALVACSPRPSPPQIPDVNATPAATPRIQLTIFAPTTTPAPTATANPTATPTPPRPVRIPLGSWPDTLHPFYASSPDAQAVLGALFVGCVGQDAEGAPVALGCERVPSADNGDAVFVGDEADRHLQVTFRIRPDWRWTDGAPVSAQDAIYAWQLIMSPEASLRDPLAQSVFSMSALDDRTVVVRFMSAAQARAAAEGALRGEVPFEYFSQLGDYADYAQRERPLAPANYWAVLRWLPAHLLSDVWPAQQRNSAFAARPVGDGAYEIEAIGDGRIVLRPSERPFPLGSPGLPGIEFIAGDPAALVQGDAPFVLPDPSARLAADHAEVVAYPAGLEQLVLNVDRFPFDDVRVRQAVAHAIDRAALTKDSGALAPLGVALTFDPARSRALLAEAGWACDPWPCRKAFNGNAITRTLEFKLTTTEREPRSTTAQIIQKQLAAVGFVVNIEIVSGLGPQSKMFAPYEQGGILLTRSFDAALYQTIAPAALGGQFACASIPTDRAHDAAQGNASGFCDAAVEALIAQAEDGEDVISPRARAEAFVRAETAIQQAAPFIPLYRPARRLLVRRVAGLRPSQYAPITWNAWEWRLP